MSQRKTPLWGREKERHCSVPNSGSWFALALPSILMSAVRFSGDSAMVGKLDGKRVAMLVEEGFEQVELTSPKEALEQMGAKVSVVSPQKGKVKAWNTSKWGIKVRVDVPLENAKAEDFDALVLPGGVMNPDKLRRNE